MRIPKTPPNVDLLREGGSQDAWLNVMRPEVISAAQAANASYLHWDKITYRPTPAGVPKEHFWWLMKLFRQNVERLPISLWRRGQQISYSSLARHQEWLHRIDKDAGGTISALHESTFDDESERYLFNSLMEEAIASSQLEGASTTRKKAKEMLRANREPRNEAERMIANNYRTMLAVRDLKDEELSPDLLRHIQNILVAGTTVGPDEAGRFRRADESIQVVDSTNGEVVHDPPAASELGWRIREICDFANNDAGAFVHPVTKAIALHFALGFVHPFVDGNGRTARAVFYWYMLKKDYWLLEYFPISRVILRAPARYARSYLHTETDNGDLTYFLDFNLDAVLAAMQDFKTYLAKEVAEQRKANRLLEIFPGLNHRQRSLLGDALKNPALTCTILEYAGKHQVTYPTAHSDLHVLKSHGLLVTTKVGKSLIFRPVDGIRTKLSWQPNARSADDSVRRPAAVTRKRKGIRPET